VVVVIMIDSIKIERKYEVMVQNMNGLKKWKKQ